MLLTYELVILNESTKSWDVHVLFFDMIILSCIPHEESIGASLHVQGKDFSILSLGKDQYLARASELLL